MGQAGRVSVAAHPPITAVRAIVARALAEDLEPLGDLSAALVPADATAQGALVPRVDGVLAGCRSADEVFVQLGGGVAITWLADDGDDVHAGTPIADVHGPLATVLTGERTALNLLGHLSGIATLTRRHVDAVAAAGHPEVVVWDTRKTIPGLRALQKAAVRAGGGRNHRGNLSEWVMLKDNHLAHLGITAGVELARRTWPGRTIHVECDRFEQVVEAAAAGASAILLDNMDVEEVRRCVEHVDGAPGGRRTLLEVSGGVTLETIGAYASTGVDCISVGALTNAAPVLDIGLDLEGGT